MKIGVLGATSPLVSIQLQQLIAESTPARKDQDHLEVVCYTNPKVAEYIAAAEKDHNCMEYHEALVTSAQLLVRAGVSMIAIPSNGAHGRIVEIQGRVPVPVANMVQLAVRRVIEEYGKTQVGLVACRPTVAEKVYEHAAPNSGIRWIVPDAKGQDAVTATVQAVKVNADVEAGPIIQVAKQLIENGAKVLVIGCARLSMFADDLEKLGKPVVDPMRVLAEHLVDQARVV